MARRPRVAFVVARCGAEAIGGAERLALETAARMAISWDVEILTTCADDYATWQNAYAPGVTIESEVTIRRFPTDRQRNRTSFDQSSAVLARDPAGAALALQEAWMADQGPTCGALTQYIDAHVADFEAFYFYSYLYATTYDNISRVGAKAILVSLAHDEWMLRLPIFARVFASATRIVCLTPEEEHLVRSRFGGLATTIISLGLDLDPQAPNRTLEGATEAPASFALYVGRIDPAKNCDELVSDYIDLALRNAGIPDLVLAGPIAMDLARHPKVRVLGPIDETRKCELLHAAAFVVIPSMLESLSLLALESWACATAVLVNGGSSVLVGQCRRSGGGLWYGNKSEFQTQFATQLQGEAIALGKRGRSFVERSYRWPDVIRRHETLVANLWRTSGCTDSSELL